MNESYHFTSISYILEHVKHFQLLGVDKGVLCTISIFFLYNLCCILSATATVMQENHSCYFQAKLTLVIFIVRCLVQRPEVG